MVAVDTPYHPTRRYIKGQHGDKNSGLRLQKIFEKALEKSKADPYASLHTLRHSSGTTCLEMGHPIKHLPKALGYHSTKTTGGYWHISSKVLKKLKRPLDNLLIK